MDKRDRLRSVILKLLERRGVEKTICPSEAARAFFPQDGWREQMPLVREVSEALAREGVIEIYQKGVRVEPYEAPGPIRLKLKNPAP